MDATPAVFESCSTTPASETVTMTTLRTSSATNVPVQQQQQTLFQTNWNRIFGGTLHAIRPTVDAIMGTSHHGTPHATKTITKTSSTPAFSQPSSVDELLNGRTFTLHNELDGDGDNCLSMQRNEALWLHNAIGMTAAAAAQQPPFGVEYSPTSSLHRQQQPQHHLQHKMLTNVPAATKPCNIAYARKPVERNPTETYKTSDMASPAAGITTNSPQAFEVDSSADSEYAESFRRSRTSNLSFKRKYKPTIVRPLSNSRHQDFDEVADISGGGDNAADNGNANGDANHIYESRVDKILKIMNTAESDFTKHRIRVTSKHCGSVKPAMLAVSAPPDGKLPVPLASETVLNYSFYALIFMVISNIVGVVLSLTYQVLLFLKLNADRFLNKSWLHWQNVSVFGAENNIVTLMLMLPVILAILVAYVTIWAAYNVNRLMLTTVPDRLADMINFNIQIVN